MKLRLTSRIVLIFVAFAAVLLAGVGTLSYRSGSESLKAAAVSEMLAVAIEKEAALDIWFDERAGDLAELARAADLTAEIRIFNAAAPDSLAAKEAHRQIVAELLPNIGGPRSGYVELFVIEPGGKVIASTDPEQEGKSKIGHPYFDHGKTADYLQPPYFSEDLHVPAMTAATPLRSPDGQLLAVLAARLDFAAFNAIIQRRTGLRQSDDSFLINADRFAVTQPRFISEPVILRRKIDTEAARRCVARNSGVILAPDYRGVPSIVVYRWNAKRQLGLIEKIDQAEALAPARAFGQSVILISILALLTTAGLAFLLARTITRPLRVMHERVKDFAEGKLDASLPESSGDEIGLLAAEFNTMAEKVSAKETQLRTEITAHQKSEALMGGILTTALDSIITMDTSGMVLEFNPAAERMFGFTRAAALGGEMAELIIPAKFREMHRRGLAHFAATGEGPLLNKRIEVTALRADGSEFPVELAITPIVTPESTVFTGHLRDITERKRAELALQTAKEEAETANRAKSEFLSRTSHELRTPMNAILGFAQLLEMQENLAPQPRKGVEQILKAGRHLLELINEVLDISRVESGRMTLSLEAVAVEELIEETASLVRPLAVAQRVDWEILPAPTRDWHVLADRQRLKQVLLNLLSNAIKYNRPGGTVKVVCTEHDGETPDAPVLRLCVTDTGHGISAEKLPRLFTPFDRLDAERTHSEVEGVGLGLALSRRLAELMGGTIGVETEAGKGSTFWVDLPLCESPLAGFDLAVPPIENRKSKIENPKTLVYIEDNLSNLKLIELVLVHRPEIKLLAAMQGQIGLDLVREHLPDLVLLDLNLPDLSGQKVLAALRSDPQTSAIPVIIISADATPGQVERLLAVGARAYLMKPIDVRDFMKVLDENLNNG